MTDPQIQITNPHIKVGLLKKGELEEAERIVRMAFGTFLGLPNPLDFMGDRSFVASRWSSPHTKVIAARAGGRLIGSNVVTRWGAFGFFGPLTVLPEYWNIGVAQRLLEATVATFERWGLRRTGLFTLPHSAKHVGLYQKFGYWPQSLTAVMTRTPDPASALSFQYNGAPVLLSALGRREREEAILACSNLTYKIDKGLDLSGEIRSVLAKRIGDVPLIYTRGVLDGFAVCQTGAGSEGGEKICYVKFGAARPGAGAPARFVRLLKACDGLAASLGTSIEVGVNLAREDAFRRMRAHGYRATMQGVAMQQPNAAGFNGPNAYVMDDWR